MTHLPTLPPVSDSDASPGDGPVTRGPRPLAGPEGLHVTRKALSGDACSVHPPGVGGAATGGQDRRRVDRCTIR